MTINNNDNSAINWNTKTIVWHFYMHTICIKSLHSITFFLCQTWKNETVAEQEKRSTKERPVLLSKDIESKLGLLDREVNYLLNKAKFAKPKSKAKAKDGASSEKNGKSNTTAEEKVIPPTKEEADKDNSGSNASRLSIHWTDGHCTPNNLSLFSHSAEESPEEVKPGEAPPMDESAARTDSENQSEPTENEATTGRSAKPVASNGDEL